MKKIPSLTILFTVLFLMLTELLNAQVTAVGNATVPPYRFLGWDGTGPGGPKDLDVKNEWNRPINFVTNGFRRMIITGGIGGGTQGRIAIGNNLGNFTPLARLHLHQTAGATFARFSNPSNPNGLEIGSNGFPSSVIRQLDDNDLVLRTSVGRFRMYGATPPPNVPEGMVLIGTGFGSGGYLGQPEFAVAGSVASNVFTDDYIVSEFRSRLPVNSSAGIKIRGSRDISGLLCAAHIDLSNWDRDENGGTDFVMSRFGSDMEEPDGQRGNLSIFTNNGVDVGETGITQAIYISADQNTGFGDENVYGVGIGFPTQRIDADGNARLRELPLPAFDANNIPAIDKAVYVDNTGVLYWKDAPQTSGSFGSLCTAGTPAALTGISEIRLNTFDFHFSGIGGTKAENNVGIGTNCFNPLPGKLTVNQQTTNDGTTAGVFINQDRSLAPDGSSVSVYAITNGDNDPASCKSVAGWFQANPKFGAENIAICVPEDGGRVSIGFTPKTTTALPAEPTVCAIEWQTNSIVEVNGTIFTPTWVSPSDINFKKNIAPITGALDKLKKINGVYYDYDNTYSPGLNLPSQRQVGFVAQNVDTVLTEVTYYDSVLQAYTMDYARVNALLVEAIKEQDAKMDSMMAKINELENCLNQSNLCNNSQRTSNEGGDDNDGQTLTLQNANAIILDQNLPNPFAENTTITYMIPEDVMEATLMFYDMNGRIINQIEITDRGESRLTVYGDKLEQGIYTYSLIADGKLIATKKMVKQ